LKAGVVTLMILMVVDLPLSEAAIRSGMDGVAGGVTIVTVKAPTRRWNTARSVAVALIARTPAAGGDATTVMDQVPVVGSAIVEPIAAVPSSSVTVLPGPAVPVKVGVVMLVMLSVLDVPLSDAAIRSGVAGAAGGVLSNDDLTVQRSEIRQGRRPDFDGSSSR
jgi:hypothetical protein